ncbi:MAG: ABC transporter permease [Sphaerochaetaceae bacterium]|jgi:ribose transport system permease protein|nr:ABC transporter permease [Bacteroidia bacterium]
MITKNIDFKVLFRKYGIILVLFVLVAIFSIGNPVFFTAGNMITIMRQIVVVAIMTIGMTFVLISGGIDLSVGTQLSFIGVVTAKMFTQMGINPFVACVIGILLGTTIGALNGLFIANVKVSPLIATLAMQQILKGLGYVISKGRPIYGLPDAVRFIGQGHIGFIPFPVILMVIFILFGMFILNKTYLGRSFYVVGSSEETGRLSGLKTKKISIIAYTMCGMLSAVAAIIMMARINSGSPTVGVGYEMDVLTAAVLGGVSISGGEGQMYGAIIGALIIGVLSNGLIIMNVSEWYQMIIKGLVLVLAIGFDSFRSRHYHGN